MQKRIVLHAKKSAARNNNTYLMIKCTAKREMMRNTTNAKQENMQKAALSRQYTEELQTCGVALSPTAPMRDTQADHD